MEDLDHRSVVSLDSVDDLNAMMEFDQGEERFAGLSFNEYSSACMAAVAVLRAPHAEYDITNMTKYLTDQCPKIPEHARAYLAIGAAYGAMHAVNVASFAYRQTAVE